MIFEYSPFTNLIYSLNVHLFLIYRTQPSLISKQKKYFEPSRKVASVAELLK